MATQDPQTILANAAQQIQTVVNGLIVFFTGGPNTFVNNGSVNIPSLANLVAQAQAAIGSASVRVVTAAADTVQAADNGNTVTLNNANAITETLPSNADVPALQPGFSVDFIQLGAGQVTFQAEAGDSIVSLGNKVKISAQGGSVTARLIAVDPNTYARTWYLTGALA